MHKNKIASGARRGGETMAIAGGAPKAACTVLAWSPLTAAIGRSGFATVLLAALVMPMSAEAGNPWRGVYDSSNAGSAHTGSAQAGTAQAAPGHTAPVPQDAVDADLYPPLEDDPIDVPPLAPAGPVGLAPLVPPADLGEFPPIDGDEDRVGASDAPTPSAPSSASNIPTPAPDVVAAPAPDAPALPDSARPDTTVAAPATGGPNGPMAPGYWPMPPGYGPNGAHPAPGGLAGGYPGGHAGGYPVFLPVGGPGFARPGMMPPPYPAPGAYAPPGATTGGQ